MARVCPELMAIGDSTCATIAAKARVKEREKERAVRVARAAKVKGMARAVKVAEA